MATDLIVKALVQVVTILVLELADVLLVFNSGL